MSNSIQPLSQRNALTGMWLSSLATIRSFEQDVVPKKEVGTITISFLLSMPKILRG